MQNYLTGLTEEIKLKANDIRLIITDVDGVLTDGGIIYDDNRLEYKKFNVKDGLIVAHLRRNGVMVGAITGRKSKVVEDRCDELNFDFHYHGIKDKGSKLKEILDTLEIDLSNVAYIGDDLIDLPILTQVGLSVCPADALPYIKEKVNLVSSMNGGQGVFREVGDMILISKGILEGIIEKLANQNNE